MNIRAPILALAVTLAALPVGRESGLSAVAFAKADAPEGWFTDATAESGLTFTHFNGMSGEFYYPEIMPPGVALFDYDNDGDLDVFIVQDQMQGGKPLSAAKPQPQGSLNSRLFRNDLKGTSLHFTDVTAESGIVTRG